MSEFTLLLHKLEAGDERAANELLTLVYDELHRIAAWKMAGEAQGLTLQPTALVHEAWLRLGGDVQPTWQNRAHFFSAAAQAMRRILIDRARQRRAVRHGGNQVRVNLEVIELAAPSAADDDQLLAVHEALDLLAVEHPRKAELVKLRFFVGFTIGEAAEALGISIQTAKRDWAYARAWLFAQIRHAPT